jgi:hypothetical protein
VEQMLGGVTLTRRESSSGFNPPPSNLWVGDVLTVVVRNFRILHQLENPLNGINTLDDNKTRCRGVYDRLTTLLSILDTQPESTGCLEDGLVPVVKWWETHIRP